MKAVVIENGQPAYVNVEPAPLRDGWSRILVVSSGLCGTDVAKISGSELPASHTRILGHEFIGQMVEANGHPDLSPGDWLVGMPLVSCGKCAQCRHGYQNLCAEGNAIGRTFSGSFADYVDVPFGSTVKISEPHEAYVLADPLAVCLQAAANGFSEPLHRCLVIGDGTIGCLLAWLLHSRGYETWLKGIHSPQLSFMKRFGVRVLKRGEDIPAGFFDVAYETVGRAQADTLQECLRAVRRRGRVIVVGVYVPGYVFPLDARGLFIGEVALMGCNAYVQSGFEEAVSLITGSKELMASFISHRFPLSHFEQALNVARSKEGFTMKVILEADMES